MKFSEIKQYPSCHYKIDVGLDFLEEQVAHLATDYMGGKVILNPDFQRGHVWTEEQQISYVEYMLKNPERGHTTTITFNNASFHSTNPKLDPNLYCIDGLQRYTALVRFMNNEIKAFGTYLDEFEDKVLLLRRFKVQVAVFQFETRKEMLEYYLMFNNGGTVHTKEELDRVYKLLEKEG